MLNGPHKHHTSAFTPGHGWLNVLKPIKTGQGRRVRIETRNVEHMWRDGGAHRVADTEPLQAVSTQNQEGSLL